MAISRAARKHSNQETDQYGLMGHVASGGMFGWDGNRVRLEIRWSVTEVYREERENIWYSVRKRS